MNIQVLLIVTIFNFIAVFLVYFLIKALDKKEKIIFIAVSIAIIYMLVSLVYMLSSIGIDANVAQKCKSFITYLFVPVNMIITVPFIAKGYEKLKNKKIDKRQFINRCIASGIIILIILVIEFFYFRNVQINVANYTFLK